MADRLYCTLSVMHACEESSASFIIRQPRKHPRLTSGKRLARSSPSKSERTRTNHRSQRRLPWRRVELNLQNPTESGTPRCCSGATCPTPSVPCKSPICTAVAGASKGCSSAWNRCWTAKSKTLGNPKAALLGFASAVLAYNVLAVLKHSVEQAHRQTLPDDWEASIFHLTVQVRSGYEGMQIALPAEHSSIPIPAGGLAQYLLALAQKHPAQSGRQE